MEQSRSRAGWWGRHSWVGVFLVGVALYVAVLRTLIVTGNPNFVPSVILLGAFLVPVTFVTYIYQRISGDRTSPDVIALAAFFGGVIGVVVAGTLEYDTMRDLGATPMLLVGLIEESAKLIVPLTILVLWRSRRPAHGVLLGVAVGMGFAALETMGYAFVALLESRGNIGAVEQTLLLRGLLSPAAHAAWTGLATAALWKAAEQRFRGRALLNLLGVFLMVVLLHAAWDTLGVWWAYAVLALISLGLLRRRLSTTVLSAT